MNRNLILWPEIKSAASWHEHGPKGLHTRVYQIIDCIFFVPNLWSNHRPKGNSFASCCSQLDYRTGIYNKYSLLGIVLSLLPRLLLGSWRSPMANDRNYGVTNKQLCILMLLCALIKFRPLSRRVFKIINGFIETESENVEWSGVYRRNAAGTAAAATEKK